MQASVSFATSCWENDWRVVLGENDYLEKQQIGHHCFPFFEKLLVINNVEKIKIVQTAAEKKVAAGILSRFVMARDVLSFFGLKREDFNEWQYYNAVGPLTALYEAKGDFLLYQTGDVTLPKPVRWIKKALRFIKSHPEVKVANLTWNSCYEEAEKEAYRSTWNFYVARQGFSDQLFLVERTKFSNLHFGRVSPNASHFPRGAVFEARAFSGIEEEKGERITFRWGSYKHENIDGHVFKR